MSNDLMQIGDAVRMELKTASVTMPVGYSFENALKSAHLILRETVDRQKRPALEVCTPDSVHLAILDMAVQGLNPGKNQCYFVVYGSKLQMIRSYMGAQMVAKSVDSRIHDIRAEVVYEGDKFSIQVVNGQKHVKEHSQTLESISNEKIIAAYAVAVSQIENTEGILFTDLMTMEEIKQAWKQSKVNPVMASGGINKDSTHGKFTAEMSRRTVINRLCKKIINTSNDERLMQASIRSDEETPTEIRVQNEVRENANQKLIDIPQQSEPEPQQPPPGTPNLETLKKIMAIEKHFKRDKEATLKNISGFVCREITASNELTNDEATEYLKMIEDEYKNEQQQPDWA